MIKFVDNRTGIKILWSASSSPVIFTNDGCNGSLKRPQDILDRSFQAGQKVLRNKTELRILHVRFDTPVTFQGDEHPSLLLGLPLKHLQDHHL